MRHFRVLEESEIPENVIPFFKRMQYSLPAVEDNALVVLDVDLDGKALLSLDYVLGLEGVNTQEYERVSLWDIRDSATYSGTLIITQGIIPVTIPLSARCTERMALEGVRLIRNNLGLDDVQCLSAFGNAGLLAGALSAIHEASGRRPLEEHELIRTDAFIGDGADEASVALGWNEREGIYCVPYTGESDEHLHVGVAFTAFFPRPKKAQV